MLIDVIDTDLLYLYKRMIAVDRERTEEIFMGLPFYYPDGEIRKDDFECLSMWMLNYLTDAIDLIIPARTDEDAEDCYGVFLYPKQIKKIQKIRKSIRHWTKVDREKFYKFIDQAYNELRDLQKYNAHVCILAFLDDNISEPVHKRRLSQKIRLEFYEYFSVDNIFWSLCRILKFVDGLQKAVRYGNKINNNRRVIDYGKKYLSVSRDTTCIGVGGTLSESA